MEHFDLSCGCGSESFERVIVQRAGWRGDYRTDFVACVVCRVMFFLPREGGTADPNLERDAALAARFYKKPGRR